MSAIGLALPPEHPDRRRLAAELHARTPETLEPPLRVTHLAVLVDPGERGRERGHLAALLAPPGEEETQVTGELGDGVRLRFEAHGEFTTYTVYVPGAGAAPFAAPAAASLPAGWLAGVPGRTIAAAHAELLPWGPEPPPRELLTACFGPGVVVGSEIGDGAGLAFTDFRLHDDGCGRFLVLDRELTPRQAGRMVQRLLEIETYRMMALLALPVARAQWPRTAAIERRLTELIDAIHRRGDEQSLFDELTALAAEVEGELAASQFRFGACRAYSDLVTTRIAELRERRLAGRQTVAEFTARRLTPAVETCMTVSRRLHELSERVDRAGSLLTAKVDIAVELQNKALLESMERRARLQHRLQQAVEALSLAAIVYYVAGLVHYAALAVRSGGVHVDPDVVVGASILPIAALVVLTVRRVRRAIVESEGA